MEQKKEFKISLKTALIGIIMIIIIIGIIVCRIFFNCDTITEYEGDYKKISYSGSEDSGLFKSIISQNGNLNNDKKYNCFQSERI